MALISSARTLVLATIGICALSAQTVKVSWDKVERVSNTTPTLQVVVNPPLRPGSAIHDRVYADLHNFGFDYVRYVPWLPYPKLAVAELEPPTNGKTSWDFSLIDPMTLDFLNAQKGHSLMLNFSTIPAWMWKTPKPVAYPQDPDEVSWDYTQGSELRDPSCKEVADYYARLVSWYVNGGFTDEYGKRYESGHHFKIDYWEVLNEIDFEHKMSPRLYGSIYDAVVAAIHKVSPETKFVALALADPSGDPAMFEYFLNPRNHKRGTPLDMISYHFLPSRHPTRLPKSSSTRSLIRPIASSLPCAMSSRSASGCRRLPRPTRMSLASSPPTISHKELPATWFSRYQIPIGILPRRCMRICLAS